MLAEVGQALAYSLIAVGIWIYHGSILRADGRRAKAAEAERLSSLHVVILEGDYDSLGDALFRELGRELPGLDLQLLDATAPEAPDALAQADLIVGPLSAAVGGDEAARIIASSPAPKLLFPSSAEGWHWIGTGKWRTRDAIRLTVRAVKQFAAGEEIKTK